MSNEVRVTLVRGIYLRNVDACDAEPLCKYPVDAFGTGGYGVEGCVVGTHQTCRLIHKVEPADTRHDHLIIEQATRVSGTALYTAADIGLYIVRSLD